MKRVMSFVAGIIGTVVSAFITFFYGYLVLALLTILVGGNISGNPAVNFLVFAYILIALCAIASLVLSILTLVNCNKSDEEYRKKRKLFIATIAINFVIVLFMFITMLLNTTAGTIVISLLTILAYVASNVLYILDLRSKKNASETVAVNTKPSEEPKQEQKEEPKEDK